jgi:arylsulfatase A-like enzyme
MEMTPGEKEDVIARYDGGIRSADAQVGRLLAAAKSWGRPFLAIITADHGESLGESGRWFHGKTIDRELISIPLVVVGDGVHPGRVPAPVGHASIMHTLLAAAGLPCDACAGSDLRSSEGDLVVDGGLPPDLLYRIAGGYRLVRNQRTGERHAFALSDTTESHDLSRDLPRLVDAMDIDPRPAKGEQFEAPEELKARLRALGYLASSGRQ